MAKACRLGVTTPGCIQCCIFSENDGKSWRRTRYLAKFCSFDGEFSSQSLAACSLSLKAKADRLGFATPGCTQCCVFSENDEKSRRRTRDLAKFGSFYGEFSFQSYTDCSLSRIAELCRLTFSASGSTPAAFLWRTTRKVGGGHDT